MEQNTAADALAIALNELDDYMQQYALATILEVWIRMLQDEFNLTREEIEKRLLAELKKLCSEQQ